MRGGYMGMLMFGMLGTFLGFATLINPIGVGAGLVMAGKSIGDERKRIVTKRQNEAKAAARRYVDDVTFQVGKDSRDRLRAVQRDLRNHFTEQAEQLKRSLAESQQAAERAVKASQAERAARQAEITAQLEALEQVRRAARALLPRPAAVAS
jgi:gas vesicle protein